MSALNGISAGHRVERCVTPATPRTIEAVRRRILFSMSVMHAPAEMMAVVRQCHSTGWMVTVLLGWEGASADSLAAQLQAEGIGVVRVPGTLGYREAASAGLPAASPPAEVEGPARQVAVDADGGLIDAMRRCRNFASVLRRMMRTKRYVKGLFDGLLPEIVVANNFHSCGRADDAILVEARRRGIPLACIMVSPLVAAAITRPGRVEQYRQGMLPARFRADAGLLNRIARRLRPDWVASDGTTSVIMWPVEEMLAAAVTGLLADDIWQVPSLKFDRVFAPGNFSASLLRQSDFPMDRVSVHAPPRLDEVASLLSDDARRAALHRHLGLEDGQPFILWNVEPSYEHNYCDRATHWARFHALADILRRQGLVVVVSLHPLCDVDNYSHVEADGTIRISRDYGIHQIYPLCAFVVSFGCSTNRYADIYGKKIILYDWFGIRADPRRWDLYRQESMEVATDTDTLAALIAIEAEACIVTPKTRGKIVPTLTSPRIEAELHEMVAIADERR